MFKVSGYFMATFLYRTIIFERCVPGCGCKNTHQKDMYFKEVGLCAQNMITIQAPIVIIFGRRGTYMTI